MVASAARPQFADMAGDLDASGLRREYASDFGTGARGAMGADEHRAQPANAIVAETAEEPHRDLDTPAFLRRLRF